MIELDGHSLTLEQTARIVFENEEVAASDASRDRVERAQGIVEEIVAKGRPVYGINTGFGRLSNESIPRDRLQELQRKIILSHAVGVGKRISAEAVRAILLFRSNSLLKGNSGIRFRTIQYLIDLLNHRVHPSIPEQGSVGSSGDLAPLAHLALVLLGKGEAEHDGRIITGDEALSLIDRPPLSLAPKEGLALLNGTQFMTGLSFLVYKRGENLLKNALAAAALSLEGLRAFTAPFDERLHQSRPHPGQIEAARAIRTLLKGSTLVDSTANDVQDAYSLRCIPQVLGPAFEALAFLKEKVTIEINAATDNPLIFTDGAVLSGGNFHGEILGLALEMVAMALSEVGNIAERQVDKLLTSPHRGLPLFLVEESGINSGLMLIQYTAASLVSENKVLCHPALVDSIPTSGGKEDHNSNLERIIAIELLCAAQAIDLQKEGQMGEATNTLHERIRTIVPHLEEDRYLAPEIEQLANAVATGGLIHGLL
jgi:histidine ammonia-lyase